MPGRIPTTLPPLLGRRSAVSFVLVTALVGVRPGAPPAFAGGADQGFLVVAHPETPASRVPRRFLAGVFLKEVTRWEGGDATRPVDLKPDTAARRRFSEAVLNRSVAAVKSYWQQRIFSGRGVPPPELESDQAVVQYVTKHRGAVGYVSPGAEIGNAKIIHVE